MTPRGPRPPPWPPLRAVLMFLSLFTLLSQSRATANAPPHPTAPPPSLSTASAAASPPRAPLVMLSAMDGTVSAFDAPTGRLLFSHRDPRPAVDSWAAPGMPEYVPGLDGLLYRIDRAEDEAHIVDGKFIQVHRPQDAVAPTAEGQSPPSDPSTPASAVILTAEDSSVLYIDVRTGRLLRELAFAHRPNDDDPILPTLSEHVVVLSRTSVGVRVLDTVSGKELANASLVHTTPSFLHHGRCLPTDDPRDDAYVAYMTAARDKVVVRSMDSGEILWSKDISTPVVEAHGLGGVRIAKSRREADAIGRARDASLAQALPAAPQGDHDPALDGPSDPRDVIVARKGKYMYAMLAAAPGLDDDDDTLPMLSDGTLDSEGDPRKSVQRYRISNDRDFSTLSSADRILGLGRLPRPRAQERQSRPTDVTLTLTSSGAGLALLALVVVGVVGYKLGSRPRSRDARRKKIRKRKEQAPSDELAVAGEARAGEQGKRRDDSDTDLDEDFDDQPPLPDVPSSGADGQSLMREFEQPVETSTGSSGSTGAGGFNSFRTQSGWLPVGCLLVSPKVLGVGSHGTVVYEGKMIHGGRKVAVKRLLKQFFESARKEISLLVELDEESPHVVRYYAMEEDSEFIYLALELCAASLAERVSQQGPPVPPASYTGGPPPSYTSRALRQLLQGLADLHRLGVVHRDVKPQNVLITRSNGVGGDIKLADVGLALRLAANRSSYTAVTNAGGGVGTTGWRAPEVLSGGRQTKAVDIFATGCVVSFVLTGGNHPFGNAIFGRDGNIVAGNPSLEALESLQLPEATDIVLKMIDPVAANRPSAERALQHPFFWTDATKLSFLVDISDRLYDTRHDPARYTENLDRSLRAREQCSDWLVRMDMELLMGLGRGYENTASGLLRVIRNKRNHYSELSPSLQALLGEIPKDKHRPDASLSQYSNASSDSTDSNASDVNFLTYFTSKVPHLIMCVYQYAIENPVLIDQPHFSRYGLKAKVSREHLSLHPFARKARDSHSIPKVPAQIVEINKGRANLQNRRTTDENDKTTNDDSEWPELDDDLVASEVIVATKPDRIAYHRHELVAIQALCPDMPAEVRRLIEIRELYQPSAFERNRKRLATNVYEECDFDSPPGRPQPGIHEETPPGFIRVMPRGRNTHSSSLYGPRGTTYSSNSPNPHPSGYAPSHPLGFSGNAPPGFPISGSPPFRGNGPPGFSGNVAPPHPGHNNPITTPNTNYQHSRRSNTANIAPTRSQFSGEERVVDFGALRRRKQ